MIIFRLLIFSIFLQMPAINHSRYYHLPEETVSVHSDAPPPVRGNNIWNVLPPVIQERPAGTTFKPSEKRRKAALTAGCSAAARVPPGIELYIYVFMCEACFHTCTYVRTSLLHVLCLLCSSDYCCVCLQDSGAACTCGAESRQWTF